MLSMRKKTPFAFTSAKLIKWAHDWTKKLNAISVVWARTDSIARPKTQFQFEPIQNSEKIFFAVCLLQWDLQGVKKKQS